MSLQITEEQLRAAIKAEISEDAEPTDTPLADRVIERLREPHRSLEELKDMAASAVHEALALTSTELASRHAGRLAGRARKAVQLAWEHT